MFITGLGHTAPHYLTQVYRYTTSGREYRLIGLESGSFLRGDYKITQRWAKVFLKALVERNSVMVVLF